MPRRARLSVPGIPWHIIQRGNNCSACFYAEDDYHKYLDTLKKQGDKYGCWVHAYVPVPLTGITSDDRYSHPPPTSWLQ